MLGQIEPFYYSLYSVIFRRTILFFLLGYSNYLLSRECWRNPITQKKPAIQRILNTPMGQIPCIAGFLDMNNKRVDRSIVSMLRSMFGGESGIRTHGEFPHAGFQDRCLRPARPSLHIFAATTFYQNRQTLSTAIVYIE